MSNKISAIIPHWPKVPELEDLLKECVASLDGYDELILVVNDGIGFGKALNRGMALAKGDYLCLVSNDTKMVKGTLRDLIDPQGVTSPMMNRSTRASLWGCFFCIPRWVYEKIGGFDEQFLMAYFEDNDYIARLREADIPMICKESVSIETKGGQTMKHLDATLISTQNAERYARKWGKLPELETIKHYKEDGSIEWLKG